MLASFFYYVPPSRGGRLPNPSVRTTKRPAEARLRLVPEGCAPPRASALPPAAPWLAPPPSPPPSPESVEGAPSGSATALRAADALDPALIIALPVVGGVLLVACLCAAAVCAWRRVRPSTKYEAGAGAHAPAGGGQGIKVDRI